MKGMLSKAVMLFVWGCSLKHRQKPFWVVDRHAVHHFKEVSFYFHKYVTKSYQLDRHDYICIYVYLTFLWAFWWIRSIKQLNEGGDQIWRLDPPMSGKHTWLRLGRSWVEQCEINTRVPNGCGWDTASPLHFKTGTLMWYLHGFGPTCLIQFAFFWGREIRLWGIQSICGASIELYCEKPSLSCLKLNAEAKRKRSNWCQCMLKNTRVRLE